MRVSRVAEARRQRRLHARGGRGVLQLSCAQDSNSVTDLSIIFGPVFKTPPPNRRPNFIIVVPQSYCGLAYNGYDYSPLIVRWVIVNIHSCAPSFGLRRKFSNNFMCPVSLTLLTARVFVVGYGEKAQCLWGRHYWNIFPIPQCTLQLYHHPLEK